MGAGVEGEGMNPSMYCRIAHSEQSLMQGPDPPKPRL